MENDNKNSLDNNDSKEEILVTEKKKHPYLKYVLYLAFILVLTGVVLFTSLYGDNWEKVVSMFSKMDWGEFSILCGAIVLIFLINSLILFMFVKLYHKHYKYHQAVANNFIGNFYSGITPGASGGQFAQVVTFKKQGVAVSSAASVLVMSYIVYQISLIILGLISVITHSGDLLAIQTIDLEISGVVIPIPIIIFVIAGFVLNLLVIVLLIFMSTSTHFHHFISVTLINFLAKIHVLKNPDKTRENVTTQVENFRVEFRRLKSNIPFAFTIFILTFLCLCITESLPYLCGLAINGKASPTSFSQCFDDLFLSIVYTNFHQMVTGLVPIPGSSGISEYVFVKLFSNYYDKTFIEQGGLNAAMLLWRFMSFHIPFLISGIVSATYKTRGIPRNERFIPSDRKTFVTVQLETLDERKVSSDNVYETSVIEREELMKKLKIKKKKKDKEVIDNDKDKEENK